MFLEKIHVQYQWTRHGLIREQTHRDPKIFKSLISNWKYGQWCSIWWSFISKLNDRPPHGSLSEIPMCIFITLGEQSLCFFNDTKRWECIIVQNSKVFELHQRYSMSLTPIIVLNKRNCSSAQDVQIKKSLFDKFDIQTPSCHDHNSNNVLIS